MILSAIIVENLELLCYNVDDYCLIFDEVGLQNEFSVSFTLKRVFDLAEVILVEIVALLLLLKILVKFVYEIDELF